ncbi:CoA ester lyase [Pseudovibrio exalbescens]|uniref:HpcH/HpaI aldolase/citrate lyase family protein n=1 Tax=Pseudovibrio exalbescens TaxID=197461 RepID=UPI002366604C|nr:CoA ester lyase [Pseudovibrio exalbescens]MDD7909468.1 CoA ester lyase [Pseudovibrio exalbescens]
MGQAGNGPRPRRSVLYMPGSNARALEKAKTLDVDALIFDLEDAVAPEAKATAREQVASAVKGGGYGHRELIIRINGLTSEWGRADLDAAIAAKPDAIALPKVNGPVDLKLLAGIMQAQGADPAIKLWAMLETPLAMLNAKSICLAAREESSRLEAVVMGTNDLSKETGTHITKGRAEMMPWLMSCLAAARAAGISIIDGVYNNFSDIEGFSEECTEGARMGMDGKTLIHPSQIDVCNSAFAPSDEAVHWARKVIAAFEVPENAGKGVLQVDGKMVERLHAEMGQKVVAIADAIAARAG